MNATAAHTILRGVVELKQRKCDTHIRVHGAQLSVSAKVMGADHATE